MAETDPYDDLDDGGLDPADETFEETRKRLMAEYASDGDGAEDADDGAKAGDASSDLAATILRRLGQEGEKSAADLTYEQQMAEAEALIAERDGAVEPYVDTEMDRLAVKVGSLDASELNFFTNQLREANEKQAREMRAGSDGFDEVGDPALPPEPPFDPLTLSSADFKTFQDAVISGGAKFGQVPAGETFDSWQAKVNSALRR